MFSLQLVQLLSTVCHCVLEDLLLQAPKDLIDHRLNLLGNVLANFELIRTGDGRREETLHSRNKPSLSIDLRSPLQFLDPVPDFHHLPNRRRAWRNKSLLGLIVQPFKR